LLPDRCASGVRASRVFTEGAGGFLPGVPLSLGCLGMAAKNLVPEDPAPRDGFGYDPFTGYTRRAE